MTDKPTALQEYQRKVGDEMELSREDLMQMLHGSCNNCGKMRVPVKSDWFGFNKLECQSCGAVKYQNKGVFGDYENIESD